MPTFGLTGLSEFKGAMAGVVARKMAATGVATATGAHLIEAKVKQRLTSSSHRKGTPTPSSPGEPPSLVSGTLRRGVMVNGPTSTGAGFTASIGPTSVYGRIQELGGDTGHSTLPARPYMAPGVSDSQADLTAIFRAAWSTF